MLNCFEANFSFWIEKFFFGWNFFFESKNFFNEKIEINPISIKKIFHIKKKKKKIKTKKIFKKKNI